MTWGDREQMVALVMKRRDCDRAEAETILDRIDYRLRGYSHEEVKAMLPLPQGGDARRTQAE